jgi:hypothetical protein
MSITIREDLASVSLVLKETFQTLPFKRDYDKAFGRIGNILLKYGIQENPRNLRLRFILCMQEFFDSVPNDKWKLRDPDFLKQADDTAIIKFMEWIIEQIT